MEERQEGIKRIAEMKERLNGIECMTEMKERQEGIKCIEEMKERLNGIECMTEMEERQTRIKRITEMEERSNRIQAWLKDETLASVEEDVRILDAYYRSPLWREDFEADEAGALPSDLPRGVLSEDGVYYALEDYEDRGASF